MESRKDQGGRGCWGDQEKELGVDPGEGNITGRCMGRCRGQDEREMEAMIGRGGWAGPLLTEPPCTSP